MAQEPALLRDLPDLQVVIDWLQVPMTPTGADSLWRRVVSHLRSAGVGVTDRRDPDTWGSFLGGPLSPFNKPTFIVSLNMVPDGCAFAVNIDVQLPVAITGYRDKVSVTVYASRSYIYSTVWKDHSPVLNYIDDFIAAWRMANKR
jgi:hypothetical protein